ncbi:MAG TPA: hypothetical protein PK189_07520, partial [bacterium]|nr:hypothetical protein [bacterium]
MKLKNKLISSNLALSLIPIIIISIILILQFSNILKNILINKFSNDVANIKLIIENQLKDKYLDLQTWSSIGAIKSALEMQFGWEEVNKLLVDLTTLKGGYIGSYLCNNEGICRAASAEAFIGYNFKTENWFTEFKNDKNKKYLITEWSNYNFLQIQTKKKDNYGIIFLKKIELDDGTLLGFLINVLDWQVIQDIFNRYQKKNEEIGIKSAYGYMTLKNNNTLITYPKYDFYEKTLDELNLGFLKNKFNNLKEKSIEYSFNDKVKTVVFERGGFINNDFNFDWVFVIGANNEDIFSSLKTIRYISAIIIIITIVIVCYFSILFARSIESNLSNVINKIKLIGKGDLKQEKIENNQNKIDEINELCEAFNHMLEKLNKLRVQAETIAADKINSEILNEKIEGDLGTAFSEMVARLRIFAKISELIASDKINDKYVNNFIEENIKYSEDKGIQEISENIIKKEKHIEENNGLTYSFIKMIRILQSLTRQAEIIANDDLYNKELDKEVTKGVLGNTFIKMREVLRELA